MSSHFEGFGMVLVEAMVQGVPAISFDCPCGPKDIIQDHINGLLVKEGDVPALAKAMESLMCDDTLRESLAAKAGIVTDTFSESVVMNQWENLFRGLLS
jgi:glycosyltransferase involved in cell wall biosynthesis